LILLGVKKPYVKHVAQRFTGQIVTTVKMDTVTMIAVRILVVVLILDPM